MLPDWAARCRPGCHLPLSPSSGPTLLQVKTGLKAVEAKLDSRGPHAIITNEDMSIFWREYFKDYKVGVNCEGCGRVGGGQRGLSGLEGVLQGL